MKQDRAFVVTVVGLNHRTAPVEQRERLTFSQDELPAALGRLRVELGGGVLLSTCNRSELYATVPADAGQGEALLGLFLSLKALQESIAPGRFYVYRHAEAVRHMYRVAAGIDSMVLGEAQILGQIRQALAAADEAGSLNGVLARLFHTAIRVGRRARRETGIGRYALSVSATAVALARRTFGRLDHCTVLVMSTGSTGKLAAWSLVQGGAARILVTNRTYSRAQELAERLGGHAVPFDRLGEALAQADVVISGTGAEGFVLGPDRVGPAMARRPGRTLLLIDIALPRDVDPAVRAISGVRLFDIDDLQAVSQPQIEGQQGEVARVEAIIEEELARLLEWWRSLDVVPVIAALRQRAEGIRRQELDKALRRLPDLSPETCQRLEAMTGAIVKKMLHDPIGRLKAGDDPQRHLEAIQELFGPLAEE
jgi:glutamyl-tRNA reductase